MNGKRFFLTSLILLGATLFILGGLVYIVDPFFHYRAPEEKIFYRLYDQRSQNDGITRHFRYDSIITGTSMAENFKASLFDNFFDTDSIKVCYSGATYKEINDNLKVAYESGHDIKYVLRPIDYSLLLRDKDEMRDDMGDYPYWLTNSNPFDDVKYLLSRDVIINYTLPEVINALNRNSGGLTSFDEYSYTGDDNTFSKEVMLAGRTKYPEPAQVEELTADELEMLKGNIEQNVVSLARKHPETTFLYFFPPYSMAYWGSLRSEGTLDKMLSCKRAAIEQMLECDNIHIYSFTLFTDVTADLNNYRDLGHYSPQINDYIIDVIYDDEYGRITKENYDNVLGEEEALLQSYDYNALLKD